MKDAIKLLLFKSFDRNTEGVIGFTSVFLKRIDQLLVDGINLKAEPRGLLFANPQFPVLKLLWSLMP